MADKPNTPNPAKRVRRFTGIALQGPKKVWFRKFVIFASLAISPCPGLLKRGRSAIIEISQCLMTGLVWVICE